MRDFLCIVGIVVIINLAFKLGNDAGYRNQYISYRECEDFIDNFVWRVPNIFAQYPRLKIGSDCYQYCASYEYPTWEEYVEKYQKATEEAKK